MRLSLLLARVARVVIAEAGKAIARFAPIAAPKREQPLGIDRGRVVIADDFDAPLPEQIQRRRSRVSRS